MHSVQHRVLNRTAGPALQGCKGVWNRGCHVKLHACTGVSGPTRVDGMQLMHKRGQSMAPPHMRACTHTGAADDPALTLICSSLPLLGRPASECWNSLVGSGQECSSLPAPPSASPVGMRRRGRRCMSHLHTSVICSSTCQLLHTEDCASYRAVTTPCWRCISAARGSGPPPLKPSCCCRRSARLWAHDGRIVFPLGGLPQHCRPPDLDISEHSWGGWSELAEWW